MTTEARPTLRIEETGAVTVITLDRPEQRNMIDFDTCVELRERFAAVSATQVTTQTTPAAGRERAGVCSTGSFARRW